ncbi:MAG: SAM-dependent methyltransferase [Nitrospirae bacterium]|nr:SAM-dependent methyltransferase [Nitrospirota bacterium]
MNALEIKISRRIRREGPLTFASFMEMALYDPDYGFYASDRQRIGREGDFYTSSHLHPVFGAIVAKQIMEMWTVIGMPEDFAIIEMGAGEGYMCNDILTWLRDAPHERESGKWNAGHDFYGRVRYIIVEKNPLLIPRQKGRVKEHGGKVTWVADVRDAGSVTGCVFSNELLDAFPVHLVRMGDTLKEIFIDHDGHAFHERTFPPSTEALARYFADSGITLSPGHTTEVNLRIKDWLSEIVAVLRRGFVFTIDYGYPAEEYFCDDRNRGTLMCYHRHQLSEDVFAHIGQQDITAHVDFSCLKRWGAEMGLQPVGYCSQGTFLLANGIDREIALLAEISPDYLFELARIKKLFMPQGLGESHKVMIQYAGSDVPKLKGFSIRNQLRTL